MPDSAPSQPTSDDNMRPSEQVCAAEYANGEPLRTVAAAGGSTPTPAGRREAMWLTYVEALAELGVPRSMMLRWRKQGLAPKFKRLPNGSLMIRKDTLDEWRERLPEVA